MTSCDGPSGAVSDDQDIAPGEIPAVIPEGDDHRCCIAREGGG